jgi:glycosyltransferase involved in cell wall biosynthesis
MSLGTAVVTSNITSIPEIVGQAGVLIDPTDINQMATAMELLLTDTNGRKQLKLAAQAQAVRFSWHETAKKTLALYQEQR